MLKNYLKIALRNLKRHKGYSFINISGLAIGIACCILILLWVQDELSYDRYHENADRIYRFVCKGEVSGKKSSIALSSAPMGPALVSEYPEVIHSVRFTPASMQVGREMLMGYNEKHFYEKRVYYTDPNVFEVFTFPFTKGNPKTALKNPYSIVITETMAKKYFGDKDALGKMFKMDNDLDLKITGVLKNIPQNSHFHFDFLISIETLNEITGPGYLKEWINFAHYTYLLLPEDYPTDKLEEKFPDFIEKYMDKNIKDHGMKIRPYLQSLTKIHLHSHLEYEIEENSDISYVYIFSAVAFFILIIASMNFMNLTTARSTSRTVEVGIRKVVGAQRLQLVKQFMGESLLLSFIAFLIAIVLVELSLPAFNNLTGKFLKIDYGNQFISLLNFVGIILFVGIISGCYPALFLSTLQPVKVLKGTLNVGTYGTKTQTRKILVVVQFVISIALITGTCIVYNQLSYLKNINLGFNKEQVVVVPIQEWSLREKYETIKSEFSQDPNVLSVAASSSVPGNGIILKQLFRPEGIQKNEDIIMQTMRVDHDFIETFGIELSAGRSFSKDFTTDREHAFILNETAVKELGWESPIGKRFEQPVASMKKGEVIGVVKNFHVLSLHNEIEPLVLHILPRAFSYISVRIRPDNIPVTLAFLKKKYKSLDPNYPFEYFFLNDQFDKLYRSEQKLGQIFGYFSTLAIFIACLGLFGLASFSAEQRTKEIGIRKVLGASISGIVLLLTKEFTKWVFFANLIAWPIAWYAMNKWLQNFAYRINIGIWTFILTGVLALVIALLTVSYQAIKAATANPVEALRYE